MVVPPSFSPNLPSPTIFVIAPPSGPNLGRASVSPQPPSRLRKPPTSVNLNLRRAIFNFGALSAATSASLLRLCILSPSSSLPPSTLPSSVGTAPVSIGVFPSAWPSTSVVGASLYQPFGVTSSSRSLSVAPPLSTLRQSLRGFIAKSWLCVIKPRKWNLSSSLPLPNLEHPSCCIFWCFVWFTQNFTL